MLIAAEALAAIAGVVVLAGQAYTGDVLHTAPGLRLRDKWPGRALPQRAGS